MVALPCARFAKECEWSPLRCTLDKEVESRRSRSMGVVGCTTQEEKMRAESSWSIATGRRRLPIFRRPQCQKGQGATGIAGVTACAIRGDVTFWPEQQAQIGIPRSHCAAHGSGGHDPASVHSSRAHAPWAAVALPRQTANPSPTRQNEGWSIGSIRRAIEFGRPKFPP
jgi:hypothetical protein